MADAGRNRNASVIEAAYGSRRTRGSVSTEVCPTPAILTTKRGSYGRLFPYDKTYDRITTKLERSLQPRDRIKYNITTSDDPVMQEVKLPAMACWTTGLC